MQSPVHDIEVPAVLQVLRAGTGTLHLALEKRLPFFSAQLDHAHYRRLLQAYYGFYQPLETRLLDSGLIPEGLDASARVKTPTLLKDLHALGLDEQAIAALPRCRLLPVLDTSQACLGTLYVLEGATLGGQVLRREIARRLGLDAETGAAFLNVYGAETGKRWKDFLDYLNVVPLDAQGRQQAADAARSTFSCFERWLDSQEVLL